MKKFIVFMLGVLVGFFLAYAFDDSDNKSPLKSLFGGKDSAAVAAVAQDPAVEEDEEYIPPKTSNKAITIFDTPGDIIDVREFEVQKVLKDGSAIARDKYHYAFEALFLDNDGQTYYDQQSIKPGSGKCFRQIGIYKYTEYYSNKTIPVVAIMKR